MKNNSTIIVLVFLSFLNLLLSSELILGSALSYIQVVIIILLLLKDKKEAALVWHINFFVLSFNFDPILINETAEHTATFNYSKIKLFNILPVSFVITILVMILWIYKKNITPNRLFNSFFKFYFFLVITGTILGLIGVVFSDYSIEYFINYFYYSSVVTFFLIIFRKSFNINLYKIFEKNLYFLLISSSLVSGLLMILNFTSIYGGVKTIPINSLFIFLPFLFLKNERINQSAKVIALISFLSVTLFSTGGKGVIFLLIIIFFIIYNRLRAFRYIILAGALSLTSLLVVDSSKVERLFVQNKNNYLISHKFNQFLTIFQSFDKGLESVSTSPQIRIAEVINIIDLYYRNPTQSFLGMGFGGPFTDSAGLFRFIDLRAHNAFYRPHDSLPVFLLLNGISGLIFFIVWTYKSIKHSQVSKYFIGLIPWISLTYGFDLNIAITGIIFLFLACYDFEVNTENNE
jgi:hypothetical protein